MGYYLQTNSTHNKADYLLRNYGGFELMGPPVAFTDIPSDEALVCVVDNGIFEAAGIAYNEAEMKAFARFDGRPKTWITLRNKQRIYDEAGVSQEDR